MTPQQFVFKWGGIVSTAKEIGIAQSHFNDVCALVGHPTPLDYDPEQTRFLFEKNTAESGRADVFFRHKFIWEYKRPDGDLNQAYQQLLRYSKALEDPPLLITSDTRRILIHTNERNENFQGTVNEVVTVTLDDILARHGVETLRRAFYDPFSFKPRRTRAEVTRATAESFVAVTDALRRNLGENPEKLAHFFARIFFCLFAEDIGLLPDKLFQKAIAYHQDQGDPAQFRLALSTLFRTMRNGGAYGFRIVPHFNGNLFDDDYAPTVDAGVVDKLAAVAQQDWSQVDPVIFGQLYERVIDPDKRAQLGAHYTSEEDINLIVEPVLMAPLRRRWVTLEGEANQLTRQGQSAAAGVQLRLFAEEIAHVRVLDPACGSGNFLYVALQKLLDLQKDVIVLAERRGLGAIPLTVSPLQLYGIEKNPYAHELAQIVIWVGYLQWRYRTGCSALHPPILPPLYQIECKDAILAYDAAGQPTEPAWPTVDVIIGNPPFLGSKLTRLELGDEYVNRLQSFYSQHLSKESDLVCYWFEKARTQLAEGNVQRVGLLATNSIRGGANREVLEKIKTVGDIFMGWSDRPWILDGAAVRVSFVGFDRGVETKRELDGNPVITINADLTSTVDVTKAQRLPENLNLAFMGDTKQGPFDISWEVAQELISQTGNPNGRSNRDVIKPWYNGLDITRRPRNMWIIDFGNDMPQKQAEQYLAPFEYVRQHVKPEREKNARDWYREEWWLHYAPRPALRQRIAGLNRYIATARLAKHRLFMFIEPVVIPDSQIIAFTREDDYFFGVLHSRVHEVWALRQGTWLGVGNDPRYTPTTTFETFPFPWPPGQELGEAEDGRVRAIAEAARGLDSLRQGWLNPPRTEMDAGLSAAFEKMLKQRTLTNLYNGLTDYRENYLRLPYAQRAGRWQAVYNRKLPFEVIEELHFIHTELDRAVLEAYGWPPDLTDEQLLERLLALNLQRADKSVSSAA